MNGVISLDKLTSPPEGAQSHLSGDCERHGKYTVEAFYLRGELRNPAPECPRCVIEAGQAQSRQEAQDLTKFSVQSMVQKSGIKNRMIECRMNNYHPVNKRAESYKNICINFVENWKSPDKRPSNLIMVGKPGNGKTHLGCAVGMAIMNQHFEQALYTRADDVASYIRASYGQSTDYSEGQAMARFGEVPLLILDELGGTVAKDHERSLLSRVIDMRYLNMLPTIMMSNLPISKIIEATDERLMDRLGGGAQVMAFDWESYRK